MPNTGDYKTAPIARLRRVNNNGTMAFSLPISVSRVLESTKFDFYTIEFVENGVLFKPIKIDSNTTTDYPDWMKEGNGD